MESCGSVRVAGACSRGLSRRFALANGLDRKRSLFDRAVLDPGAWRVPGAVYSIMAHTAALTGLLVLALTGVLPELTHPRTGVPRSRIDLSEVVFLPVLGGGAGSDGETGAGEAGLAYPGPQPILSEFPDPTNAAQTVQRPGAGEPEVQDPSAGLPNMVQLRDQPAVVQIASPEREVLYAPVPEDATVDDFLSGPELAALAAPLIRTLEAVPALDLTPLAAGRSPVQPLPPRSVDLALPTRTLRTMLPILPLDANDAGWVRPDLSALATPQPRVEPFPVSWTADEARDAGELLTLSPTPAARRVPVPDGEARGAFAISPTPSLDTTETRPGVAVAGSDAGVGGGGTGSGAGGPFAGITILAGGMGVTSPAVRDSGAEARIPADDSDRGPNAPGFLQQFYGVTLVTTESSGGGLPDFGVFDQEQVHTVFVDMRQEVDDPAPAWTVAYGVPQGTRVEAFGDDAAGAVPGFQLPFPIERRQLELPEETVARYYQRRVIAYAVVDTAGTLTDIAVMETPAPALAGPVLDALAGWRFRPARLDGEVVPVKVLLGIPIWTAR